MQNEMKVNILLVDDQPNNLLALSAILDSLGHNLVKAHSGESALRCLLKQDFAVIVLDVQMPGMDGFETAKLIRERPALQDTPIIFITAIDRDDTYVLKGYSLGAVEYLLKPIVPEILISKVAVFISLFQKTQQVKRQAAQLAAANKELEREIGERKQAEAALQKAHDELERQVEERTAELRQVNEELLAEIVERRQVEIALKKSEQRYRTLIETIPHGIQEIDTTGIITFSNLAHYRMLGYKEGELLGKSIWDLTPESERLNLSEYLAMLVQDMPPPTPYLGKNFTKDGNLIDIQVNWNYKRDDQGQVIGFILAIADITQRQRTEEALKLTQFCVDSAVDAITWIGSDARFLYANDTTCRVLGYSRSELLAMSLPDVDPDVTAAVWSNNWQALKQRGSLFLETRHRSKDGRIFSVEIAANYLEFNGLEYACCFARDISDRLQAEESLRISAERFRIALKNSPIVVFNQDTELRYTWLYNPVPEFAGKDILGKRDSDIFAPEDAQRLTAIKQQVLTTKVGTRQETFLTLSQEVRYFDLTVEPWFNKAGEIIGITCASTDITKIRAREQQLRAIFEDALDAIAIVDDEGSYLEANPAACQLFGMPLTQLLGRKIGDFMQPDYDFEVAWRTFLELGQVRGAVSLLRPDGTVRIVEFAAKANFLPGRHLSMLRDITSRKQAEKALLESQRFIQQITDTTPTIIYVFDLNAMRNTYLNSYGSKFFGHTLQEIQAMGQQFFAEVLHPEDFGKLAELHERFATAKDGEVIENEFRMKNANGEWRWLHSWDVVFARTAEGIPEQMLGTAIDITEQKHAEEISASLEAEKELRRLQLRFFSMASHEFRTPLSTIIGSTQVLKSCAQDWPEQKRLRNLHRLEKAAKNMTQLLNDLLTINRAETGKLEFHPQPIELEKFCFALAEEMQLTAGYKHKITFVSQGKCSNASLDEKLLNSILTNLLSNAIKYSPEGGEIQFSLKCTKSKAIFQIKDEGIGIPPEDQQHLFELFHRGKNVENIPGTGLGLCVVKKCLELPGGEISINSKEGVGTTVIVTIPLS